MKRKITLLAFLILASITVNALNYYWVGGTGNWSDYSHHCASTSGGNVFHNQVPQSTDNVFFDANSFSAAGQKATIDQTVVSCANMDWTGVTHNPSLWGDYSSSLEIYGSLTLVANLNLNFF